MAKKPKKSAGPAALNGTEQPDIRVPHSAAAAATDVANDLGGPFVGQWNRLVSTTNWEKGRIICQWRDALIAAGEPVTAYSDEAWSQLVGGVTSQHVGRLRRVFQRFGEAHDQFDALYWSHFQSALEWQDAEMWLEGAIHNGWSVSQMRGKRWETLGLPGEPADEDVAGEEAASESAASASDAADNAETAAFRQSFDSEAASATATSTGGPKASTKRAGSGDDQVGDDEATSETDEHDSTAARPAKSRSRLSVDVDELPSDLADAFEQFKLAIIAHRRDGWRETTADAVIECLDALRELTLAPGGE